MAVSPDAGGVRLAHKWVQQLGEFHGLQGTVAFLNEWLIEDVGEATPVYDRLWLEVKSR